MDMYARRSAAAHEQRIATAALLVGSEAAGKWDTPSKFQACVGLFFLGVEYGGYKKIILPF